MVRMIMDKYDIAIIAVISIMLIAALGCKRASASASIVEVQTGEALTMWRNEEAVIIDIRTQDEYQEGHIPGAALIPLDQLGSRMNEVPRDRKVLLICRSGNRSAKGTSLLRSSGFDNVYNVTGGMLEWRGPQEK